MTSLPLGLSPPALALELLLEEQLLMLGPQPVSVLVPAARMEVFAVLLAEIPLNGLPTFVANHFVPPLVLFSVKLPVLIQRRGLPANSSHSTRREAGVFIRELRFATPESTLEAGQDRLQKSFVPTRCLRM